MDSLKKYIFSLFVLALLVVAIEPFRLFFMANVIQPIALVCWAAWRIVASVDQNVYWTILIVVCLILVIRLIPGKDDSATNLAYQYSYKSSSRVEYWKTLIADGLVGKEREAALRDALKQLLVSAIPHMEGSGSRDLEERLATGKVGLSPQARRFLFPPGASRELSFRHWFSPILPRWLRRSAVESILRDPSTLDEILAYIETQMEIRNDR
jgi:hypothetical protein